MRKVILFNMVTLDGFFEGPNSEIGWHNVDEEFNEFAIEQMNAAGGLIFGRKTYELMERYWPTPEAQHDDPQVAELMNNAPKIVFSRTLDRVDWINTRLVNGRAEEEVARLRQETGRDLLIFGSADLAASLAREGLIDEYRLMVNPVALGRGRSLFEHAAGPFKLKLCRARTFQNGNVLLTYQPEDYEE